MQTASGLNLTSPYPESKLLLQAAIGKTAQQHLKRRAQARRCRILNLPHKVNNLAVQAGREAKSCAPVHVHEQRWRKPDDEAAHAVVEPVACRQHLRHLIAVAVIEIYERAAGFGLCKPAVPEVAKDGQDAALL